MLYNKQEALCKAELTVVPKKNPNIYSVAISLTSEGRFSVLNANINLTKAHYPPSNLLNIFKPKGTGVKCFCDFFLKRKNIERMLVLEASKLGH